MKASSRRERSMEPDIHQHQQQRGLLAPLLTLQRHQVATMARGLAQRARLVDARVAPSPAHAAARLTPGSGSAMSRTRRSTELEFAGAQTGLKSAFFSRAGRLALMSGVQIHLLPRAAPRCRLAA